MFNQVPKVIAVFLLLGSVAANAGQQIWQDLSLVQMKAAAIAGEGRYLTADDTELRRLLQLSPTEYSGDRSNIIPIPLPDGSFSRFAIVASPIMEPELAARYPEIKNYKAYGIDDPTASGRLSYNPQGFGGMLHTSQGRIFIDPAHSTGQNNLYVLRSQPGDEISSPFQCGLDLLEENNRARLDFAGRSSNRVPGNLLTYRLAVASTFEYYAFAGGSDLAATIEINKAIDRVNAIFERDLGIRLMLIGNNHLLYETGDNGLDNNEGLILIGQVQGWIDGKLPLGKLEYDIGHIFSTGGGGYARVGVVCDDSDKAKGVTGLHNPTGDPFYIDYLAHEIGHQFGAEHSFNGTTYSCGGINRVATSAFEPGSGSTIMGYAGICGDEDLQRNSDATFHAGSIAQINALISGAACNGLFMNGNVDPTILVPVPDRVIPVNTAFVLDNGSAVDTDPLEYQWDQMDTGSATDASSFGTDLGDNPLFRSYQPRANSHRNFPALGNQVIGEFDDAEVLPCAARNLDFRLTVRDNNSGQVTEDVRVNVHGAAGPFRVTNFNFFSPPQQVIVKNNSFVVTWDVANTDSAPISCANVDIDLLTFNDAGYTRYSAHSLEVAVPNNGTRLIDFPQPTLSHPRARVRVKCSNNIFYDINDADINIVGSDSPLALYSATDNATFFNNNDTAATAAPACNAANGNSIARDDSHDSGAFDFIWLLLLGSLAAARNMLRRQS